MNISAPVAVTVTRPRWVGFPRSRSTSQGSTVRIANIPRYVRFNGNRANLRYVAVLGAYDFSRGEVIAGGATLSRDREAGAGTLDVAFGTSTLAAGRYLAGDEDTRNRLDKHESPCASAYAL